MNSRILLSFTTSLLLLAAVTREVCCQVVGAVYFLSNNDAENHVIASGISPDGKLSGAKAFKTRGKGATNIFGQTNGLQKGLDPLASQDAIIVNGNLLFAVNAGDNSVTMFGINKHDPTCLIFKAKVDSGGEFPIAVAYSDKLKMLCVTNGGKVNNVQCFNVPNSRTVAPIPGPKPLNLVGAATPPNLNDSVSDILFSPDSSKLIVAVKGKEKTTEYGHFLVYDIKGGVLGEPVKSQPKGAGCPFGFSIVPGTGVGGKDLWIAYSDFYGNAAGGYGFFKIEADGSVKPETSIFFPVAGQMAICWTVFSLKTKSLYLTDPVTNLVTEATIGTDGLKSEMLKQHNVTGLPLDATIAALEKNDILYVLAVKKPSIQVVQIVKAGEVNVIQDYEPQGDLGTAVKLAPNVVGIANYVVKKT